MTPPQIIPRVRGSAIPFGAGWGWELEVQIGNPRNVEPIGMSYKGTPYLNKEAALNDLKKAAADILQIVCQELGQPMPEQIMDLVENKIQTADEFRAPVSYGEKAEPVAPEPVQYPDGCRHGLMWDACNECRALKLGNLLYESRQQYEQVKAELEEARGILDQIVQRSQLCLDNPDFRLPEALCDRIRQYTQHPPLRVWGEESK